MNKRLREIADANAAEREHLLRKVDGLTQEQLDFRPSADKWSIGEVLNHLNILETRVGMLLHKKTEEGKSLGHTPDTDEESVLPCLDHLRIPHHDSSVNAPELVHPKSGISKSELLEALSLSREKLLAAMENLSAVDPTKLVAPHPLFGEWNMYKWAIAIGQHERRHTVQIDAVKSAPGFPSSAATTAI